MTTTRTSIWRRQILPGRPGTLLAGVTLGGLAVVAGFGLADSLDRDEPTPVVYEGRAELNLPETDEADVDAADLDVDALVATIPTHAATDLEMFSVWEAVDAAVAQAASDGRRLGVLVQWGPYVADDPTGAGVATYRADGAPMFTLVTAAGGEDYFENAEAAQARAADLAAEWGGEGDVVEVVVTG